MNQVPTKIVLKSTTRMSLNDRFSNIAPTVQTIRANAVAEHQVSVANRRLAQQLANRPGIPQASTMAMYTSQPGRRGMAGRGFPRRGALQQRLGKTDIKSRLTLPNTQFTQQRGRGGGRGRGRGGPQGGLVRDNSQQWFPQKRGGRGTGLPMRSPRSRGTFRGRGRGQFNRLTGQTQSTNFVRGGSPRGGRGQRRGGRGIQRGQGRGRGRGGRGAKTPVSVTDLDNELDAYMSKALDS